MTFKVYFYTVKVTDNPANYLQPIVNADIGFVEYEALDYSEAQYFFHKQYPSVPIVTTKREDESFTHAMNRDGGKTITLMRP